MCESSRAPQSVRDGVRLAHASAPHQTEMRIEDKCLDWSQPSTTRRIVEISKLILLVCIDPLEFGDLLFCECDRIPDLGCQMIDARAQFETIGKDVCTFQIGSDS